MKKKEYIIPTMEVVKIQHQNQLLAGSINDNLHGEEVEEGWSREFDDIEAITDFDNF